MPLLPGRGCTRRLLVRDADPADCDRLQQLYETGAYLEPWFGGGFLPGYMKKLFSGADLPPGGCQEQFQLQAVYLKEDPNPVGLLELYHGYPDHKTLWIAYLYFHPDHQQRGYGRELANHFFSEAARAGYTGIGLGVQLKNWPGLRFWFKLGFDRITGVYGDPVHGETAFSHIGLYKDLTAVAPGESPEHVPK